MLPFHSIIFFVEVSVVVKTFVIASIHSYHGSAGSFSFSIFFGQDESFLNYIFVAFLQNIVRWTAASAGIVA